MPASTPTPDPCDTLDGPGEQIAMKCTELAQQIEQIQPNASPQDVARLCLLLTNEVDNLDALRERTALHDAWKQMGLQLQLATDQHAAMTQELEDLAASRSRQLHPGPNLDSDPRDQGPKPGAADVRRPPVAGRVRGESGVREPGAGQSDS